MWQKLQTLPNQQTHRGKILYWHIRDGAVWHQHHKIRRADPATLEVFQTDGGSGFIARDKNHVYHAWTTLKNIDRASFEHIAAYLWRDKNHVYAEHETSLRPIAEADPATFRYLGQDWAADQCHAYYAARRVKHYTRPDTLASSEHATPPMPTTFTGTANSCAKPTPPHGSLLPLPLRSPAMPAMFTATGTRSPKPTPQAGGICTTAFPKNSATSITVHASSPAKTPPIGTRNAPGPPMPCVSCGTSPKPKQTIRQPENRRFQRS